jgi:hypothetical protein
MAPPKTLPLTREVFFILKKFFTTGTQRTQRVSLNAEAQ